MRRCSTSRAARRSPTTALTSLTTITGVGLVAASATRWGGTLGVGFEYGFTPNWSFGAEYNHLWMGTSNNSFTVADPVLVATLNNRITQDVDMFTLRINYRFGGYGGPGDRAILTNHLSPAEEPY